MNSGIDVFERRRVWAHNIWCPMEVLDTDLRVAWADQGPNTAPGSNTAAVAAAAIDAALPQRRELFGQFLQAGVGPIAAAADWVHLLGEVALTLQSHARPPRLRFHCVMETADPSCFRLVIEAREHQLAEESLEHAVGIVAAARAGAAIDLADLLPDLVKRADDVCLGPSTMLIVRAAEARDIPWVRISDDWSLVQLGQGARQRRIWTAETSRTSAIAEAISRNKQLTKRILEAAGVPVPRGRLAATPAEAWEAAQAVGLPVVIKPLDANHGRGVFLNLATQAEVEAAFPGASEEARTASPVIVEHFIPGVEHRLLVVGSHMVACAQGEYIYVTGNNRQTVAELIDVQINSDARRGGSETLPNNTILIDLTVLAQLAQEGATPQTVPAEGRRVLVKRTGTHGADVTESVHPEIAAVAVRAARAVGLDVAGIDLVAQDITQPLIAQGAMVCEVNAGPQLLVHTMPSSGPGQPVGALIVAELFPAGQTGRIPVAAVMGGQATGGDSAATARLIECVLHAAGRVTGLTCGLGKWIAGWLCATGPHTTAVAARDLLMSPEIDAAVFELDPRAVVSGGLTFDRVDVLVLLLGSLDGSMAAVGDERRSAEEVLTGVVAPSGTIIIPDDQPALVALTARQGNVLLLLSGSDRDPPAGTRHAVGIRSGEIMHFHAGVAVPIVTATEGVQAALAVGGEPKAALAAVAAAICLGLSAESIRAGFTSASLQHGRSSFAG